MEDCTKVLINAYACSPDMGSEPGMGWNWCVNLARHCELFIITEEEFRDRIEATLPMLPYGCRMHFYYIPVTERVRRMCWNQGDWRFYHHYRLWQKRAFEKAREILAKVDIDLVHQLNMVGFREPGYLWKLDKPLVWGPIGGMVEVPARFLASAPVHIRVFQRLKNVISKLQFRLDPRINQAFQKADALIAAIPATQRAIKEIQHRDSVLIPETGCYDLQAIVGDKRSRQGFHVIWVGRFYYYKRLDLALRAIAAVKDLPGLRFHIVGTGDETQVRRYKTLAKELCLDDICEWHGSIENSKVHEMMREADLFFFTSISEATSTVVPEAINNALPVICFDACGFGPLVTDRIGRKVTLSSPDKAVRDFADQIRLLYHDRNLLHTMSCNCHEVLQSLLWKEKARRVADIYQSVIRSA